jgi:hypothetical protein
MFVEMLARKFRDVFVYWQILLVTEVLSMSLNTIHCHHHAAF